jgi:hypothetical protein
MKIFFPAVVLLKASCTEPAVKNEAAPVVSIAEVPAKVD